MRAMSATPTRSGRSRARLAYRLTGREARRGPHGPAGTGAGHAGAAVAPSSPGRRPQHRAPPASTCRSVGPAPAVPPPLTSLGLTLAALGVNVRPVAAQSILDGLPARIGPADGIDGHVAVRSRDGCPQPDPPASAAPRRISRRVPSPCRTEPRTADRLCGAVSLAPRAADGRRNTPPQRPVRMRDRRPDRDDH